MTFSLIGDTADNEVNNQNRSLSLEGTQKPTAIKGEYIRFTITPFHLCILCTTPFHHIAISPCEHGCVLCEPFQHMFSPYFFTNPFHYLTISPCEHGCVFSAPFHHIYFTIALYQSISLSHCFTFSPLLHIFTAKRR